jgi:UDP:flavonoid glycosyltransferase YjiC (YdhE family)
LTISGGEILFIGESATRAHVARPWTLANALRSHGWKVSFAADRFFEDIFMHGDIRTISLSSRSPGEFLTILERNGVIFDEHILRKYVEGDTALLRHCKPTAVVGDLRLSLAVSAPLCGVPYIALTNGYWSPKIRSLPLPFSAELLAVRNDHAMAEASLDQQSRAFEAIRPSIFATQAAGVDRVRRDHGLPAFSDYLTGFCWGDRTVYSDLPSFISLEAPPANHSFIGPVCWSPSVAEVAHLPSPPKGVKTIYVSLGSSGSPLVLEPLLSALRTLDHFTLIATAGAELPGPLPRQSFTAPLLPGHAAAELADVVITNGGSPATHQALSAGKPVLGLPFNMDQLLCMEHIQGTGAVLSVRADMATEGRITEALDRLLNDPKFSSAARTLKRQIEAVDVGENLSNVLKGLLGSAHERKVGGIHT